MASDLQSTPRFSVGRQLATMVASCGILDKAWDEICNITKYDVDFLLKQDDGVAYVSFPSFAREDFIVTESKYGEYSIQDEKIFSASLKGTDDKKALVHMGAFNRFLRIVDSSDFQDKMQGLKEQAIIFVGHSMGGAVATLTTLWCLQKEASHIFYFCITFGSPLVGNAILGEAIGREDWTKRFCHVVSRYDIVPRMLLAPFESVAESLSAIVPHWGSIMGIDHVAGSGTHLSHSVPEACKTLLEKILQCTSTIANNYPGESDFGSPYRPFGTYMFCSTQGAACIDDPEAVLKMLHFTMQGLPSDQLAGTCLSGHTDYGQILEIVTEDLGNALPNANFAEDAFQMGMALELEAIGVGAQNHHAIFELRKAGEMKNEQDVNIEKLNNDLNKSRMLMARIEWYKGRCKKGSGYYDTFKQHGEKPEFHVNFARIKLRAFWDEIVENEEKHVLPSDFRWQNKWINAGSAYRRLVEPLDIAHYYRRRKDNKSYLSDGVRPHSHLVLEKWLKEKEQTRAGRDDKNRTKFASLTLDSCFWARIEDACQTLPKLQQGQDQDQHQVLNALLQKCQEFENYVWDMIKNKSVSVEIFLEQSSFMKWWKQYSSYLQHQTPEWKASSPLFSFMANQGWK